jgi:hypothetical protein
MAPRWVSVTYLDGLVEINWAPVAGAGFYEVSFGSSSGGVPNNRWPQETAPLTVEGRVVLDHAEWVRVRAIHGALYGPWSRAVELPRRSPLDVILDSVNTHFSLWVAGLILLLVLFICTSPPVMGGVRNVIFGPPEPVPALSPTATPRSENVPGREAGPRPPKEAPREALPPDER